jgi:UDP-N-acetylmuramoylalanine--D-glutamate ligase
MIVSEAFKGKTYAVLGLARSGLATVASLLESGAHVTAWDSNPASIAAVRASFFKEADPSLSDFVSLSSGGKLTFGDPMEIDLAGFDGIVVSPGVPLNRHPIAMRAKLAGVPIIGDIELFALARPTLPPHKVVGITGTNGKSTTTALIHHIIQQAGYPTVMGGNIGLPILSQPPLEPNLHGVGVYVLELSSYQIDLTHSLDCDVAVLLNITPDHLDRYDGFEGYVASKLRLFDMMKPPHVGVLNWHTEFGQKLYHQLAEQHQYQIWTNYNDDVSDPYELWGAFDESGQTAARDHLSTQKDWPALQGPHNAENAIASILTCSALGVAEVDISEALKTYASLPHRMQAVRTLNGVLYVNDSKATNAASTAPALAAWPAKDGKPRIHWILGGVAKSDNLDECVPHYANIAHAYTIGEAGHMFADLLRPHMAVDDSEMLSAAVRRAARIARPGDVVLLSPACASFDQFRDFEARGDAFAAAVNALE